MILFKIFHLKLELFEFLESSFGATAEEYFGLVRDEKDKYAIIKVGSIFGYQPSWIINKIEWPGAHQANSKLKLAKWFDQEGDAQEGDLLSIGSKLIQNILNKLLFPLLCFY